MYAVSTFTYLGRETKGEMMINCRISRTCALWIRAVLVTLVISTPLAAQDTSHVALVMGARGPGLLVFISQATALRFDGSVAASTGGGTDSWTENGGVSALFYLHQYDGLRTYAGPRISYSHSSVTGSSATTHTLTGQLFFGTDIR
jgi:hypothetical protein